MALCPGPYVGCVGPAIMCVPRFCLSYGFCTLPNPLRSKDVGLSRWSLSMAPVWVGIWDWCELSSARLSRLPVLSLRCIASSPMSFKSFSAEELFCCSAWPVGALSGFRSEDPAFSSPWLGDFRPPCAAAAAA